MLLVFEDQPKGLDLLGVAEDPDVLPDKVIPFAADPGDNYLSLDYRPTETDPPVVFRYQVGTEVTSFARGTGPKKAETKFEDDHIRSELVKAVTSKI